MRPFYVTTPLYYVNDKPHLGSAYSTTVADILTRYHRLFGEEAFFLTGTDEHGQKVQQAADARGKSPQEHCDELSKVFKETWAQIEIKEDFFFRTTDDFHKKVVQDVLQDLYDRGEIYADTYAGWYSVSEEIFYTEKELVDGKTPSGKDVVKIEEKNYFFKMSKYQDRLIKYINDNPEFIQPSSRRNEVLGFLQKPLADLCISRPKKRLSWGVEIPFDTDYVTYVWFDALLNYATGVGYGQKGREEEFNKWWNEAGALHIIGKDILITHSVYWPTMLMAMNVKLPKTIFAHGWILNRDNEKMSKSKGSVMSPLDLIKTTEVDPLRYFLLHDVPFGSDAPVSHELIAQRINSDLANNLGNLLSRSANLVQKFFEGKAPAETSTEENAPLIQKLASELGAKFKAHIENYELVEALELVIQLLNESNKFLELRAPWKLGKEDPVAAGKDLKTALEALRIAAIALTPVMPNKMASVLEVLGIHEARWADLEKWNAISAGTLISKPSPLFPRIDWEKA